MFPNKPQVKIKIPSKTELLKMVVEISSYIAVINQFDQKEAHKIALAVDEAITNVIEHSYLNNEDGSISLEFFSSHKGLKIIIVFNGIPPVMENFPVDLNEMIKMKKKGGLGVQLMRRIMDSVEYKTTDDINYCEMVKWKTKN